MKIEQEILNTYSINKDFDIELDNGEVITVNKYIYESDNETDGDWNIIDGKEIYDKLTDDKQDEVDDFINNIKL